MSAATVRAGQVWADNDSRCKGRRTLRVEQVVGDKAVCLTLTDWDGRPDGQRRTLIAVRRFKPTSTGYRLIQDVAGADVTPRPSPPATTST